DLGLEPLRECVHDRHTHPVETTRHLVGALLELAASVQGRENGGQTGELGLVHLVDGNATTVVDHLYASVGAPGDLDARGEASHRLVHRVVHHLPDEMVEPSRAGGTDVHPRTEADRLETFENGDVFGCICVARGRH